MRGIAQRLALPAGGWDETTPLCRNQLQATQTAQKRGDSHQSGARCVGQLSSDFTPSLLEIFPAWAPDEFSFYQILKWNTIEIMFECPSGSDMTDH